MLPSYIADAQKLFFFTNTSTRSLIISQDGSATNVCTARLCISTKVETSFVTLDERVKKGSVTERNAASIKQVKREVNTRKGEKEQKKKIYVTFWLKAKAHYAGNEKKDRIQRVCVCICARTWKITVIDHGFRNESLSDKKAQSYICKSFRICSLAFRFNFT